MTTQTVACADRVDLPALRAYAQTQDKIYTDGNLTSTNDCTDDLYVYQINFNGTGCTDDVDSAGGYAYDRGKPYYINSAGSTVVVGGCQRYANRMHAIAPTEQGCTHDVDIGAGIARIRTRQVYTSSAGTVVVVSGCAASGTTASIQWTTGGCDIRPDIGAGTSFQQARRFYTYNGAEYPVGGCQDHGNTYPHFRTETGCTNVENDASHTVQIFKRTVANYPNGLTTIVDCSADSTIGMAADYVACQGQYSHNPAAGVSYGMVRYTYQVNGALQASACVVDPSRVYRHEDAMGSWTHDDNNRQSRQSIITYIDTEIGRVVVSQRDGPWVADYQATGTEVRPNVQGTSYSGCNRIVPNNTYTTFTRTDGTSVTLLTGGADSTVTADGCSPIDPLVEVVRTWDIKTTNYNYDTVRWGQSGDLQPTTCTDTVTHYAETRTTPRWQNGAGQVFSGSSTTTTAATGVDSNTYGCDHYSVTTGGG